jgi:hypothetical protein
MMYLFLTNHRQDVLTSSRKITARKRFLGCIDCRDLSQVFEHEGLCHTLCRINRYDGHSVRSV